MGVVLYVARNELRRRASALVVLALLVGLTTVAVLSCATAARRSQSALDRLSRAALVSDLTLELQDLALAEQVTELPMVEHAAVLDLTALFPADAGDDYLPVLADRSGTWTRTFDRVRVLEGVLPPVTDPDAIVITDVTAARFDVTVGERLPMVSASMEQLAEEPTEDDLVFEGPSFSLEVAAVVRMPPVSDDPNEQNLSLLTPAFLERHQNVIPTIGWLVAVRLTPDASTADLVAAIRKLPGGETVARDAVGTGGTDANQAALNTVSFGLMALAVASALAGVVIAGQAVSRLVLSASDSAQGLMAMGVNARTRRLAFTGAVFVPIVAGVAVGALVAPLLARRLVGDLARRLDPEPGLIVDRPVLIVGVLLLIAVLASIAVATARAHDRGAGRERSAPEARVARLAASAGLASPVVAGLSLAFSRSGRRVPIRQALVVASIGVIGVVGVTVFGESLDRALEQPRLHGWAWDASLANDMEEQPDELDRRGVTEAALVSYNLPVQLNGEPVPGVAMQPIRGRIDPVLVRGELPRGLDEVLVGERTLDDLRAGVGDRVELRGPAGALEVTIVGTMILAAPDGPLPLARGALIDIGLLDQLGLAGDDDGTGTEVTYRQLAVAVDRDARDAFHDLTEGDDVTYPAPPIEVSRLADVQSFPVVLAAFLAALAAVGVGHALSVVVRRRRLDLGVLRALGYTRGQTRLSVLSQGVTVAIVALVVGVPVGLVVGRLSWGLVTTSIGLPFQPFVPAGGLAVVGIAVVAAVVLAAAPSLLSIGRICLAEAVRAE